MARALGEEHPEVLRRAQGGRVVPTVAGSKGSRVIIVTRGVGLQEFLNFDIRFCDEYTIFREFVDF